MTNEHKEPWTPGPGGVSSGSDPGIPDVRVFCDRDTPVADVLYTDRGPIANARLIAEARVAELEAEVERLRERWNRVPLLLQLEVNAALAPEAKEVQR